jgi:S1-C subfamily serine protease
VTTVDWVVLGLVALTALTGARRGLIASLLGLAGIVVGAIVGARLAPHVLRDGGTSPYTPLVGLAGAVLFAALLQGVGQLLGSLLRSTLRIPPLRAFDTAGGFVVGALTGLGAVWVLGAVALNVPGQTSLREQAQQSEVIRRLNEIAPPSTVLRALARFDPFPTIVGPAAPTQPPDPEVLAQPGVRRAAPSVVRILGTACGLGVEGSGWVYARGYVVTAAHVVAGERDTSIVTPTGRRLRAVAVVFDRRNDIAVLRVAGLHARPLPLVDPKPGLPVAILGYPENGPFDAQPGRLGQTTSVLPAPGRSLPRLVTSVRGLVRHGNSGGPVVDAAGNVRAVVFAKKEGADAGYAVPAEIVGSAAAHLGRAVSTGPCVAD